MAPYQPNVIVICEDGFHIVGPDGRNQGQRSKNGPTLAMMSLARMLERTAERFRPWPEGTVLVTVPGTGPWATAEIPDVICAGWQFTHGTVTGWTTFTRSGSPTIHLGLVAELDSSNTGRMWQTGNPWSEVAVRLARYHQLVGAAYRMTPGVSGCASVRSCFTNHRRGAQPYWGVRQSRGHADMARGAGDLQRWEREPDITERLARYVHVYDANRARLAAAGNADLAWGKIEATGAQPFDPAMAGYWHVRLTPKIEALALGVSSPPLFNLSDVSAGAVWLTTPVMRYLLDLGINPEVLDSRTEGGWQPGQRGAGGGYRAGRGGKRILREWAHRLDTALLALDAEPQPDERLVVALKLTYREMFGMIAREGGSIYRWDWSDTVLDLGRVNLLRKCRTIHRDQGVWPLRFHTDALYYASDEPDPQKAFPSLKKGEPGDREYPPVLGTFKITTIPMPDWLDGRRK